MVRGKSSNQSARQVDIPPLSLRDRMDKMNEMEIMLSSATTMTMRDEEWCPIVGESGTDPQTGMKGLPCKD